MKVSLFNLIIFFYYIDIIPGINNYNPLKCKKRRIGNPYNNINIIGNNNRENNFKKKTKSPIIYNRPNINNNDTTRPIKLLNTPGYKNSTSSDKGIKSQSNNIYLIGQQFGSNRQQINKNSIDNKRPSTAPQKYKIKKNRKQ